MPRRSTDHPQPSTVADDSTQVLVPEEPALPGSAQVEPAILDQAVSDINRIYVGKGLEMYFAVGEYVLATFFGGDPEAFHARGRTHATFRALADRQDLRLSYSALYNAVAVVDQRRLLPAELTAALPFTHQKLLLPVRDETLKVDLARKAIEDELSTRELAQEVRRLKQGQREGSKLGRPLLPAWVKAFGRLKTVHAQATSEPITAESFANYPPEKARSLLTELEQWLQELQQTADQVRQAMESLPPPAEPDPKPGEPE